MYAVIETGGKQYRVEVGTELEVELLDVEPGKTIALERILLVADGDEASIGRPLVADAAVSAEVVRQTRGEKLISFKYRPKARSRVKKGHRQELTVLRIADITLNGKSAAKAASKAAEDAKTERERVEEAAAAQAARDAALAEKLSVGATPPPAATPKRSGRAKAAEATESADEPKATTRSKAAKPKATESPVELETEPGSEAKPQAVTDQLASEPVTDEPISDPVMAEAEEAETTDPATTAPEAVAVAADVESESPEVEVFAVDPDVTTAEPAASNSVADIEAYDGAPSDSPDESEADTDIQAADTNGSAAAESTINEPEGGATDGAATTEKDE
jgi:large subunit ribosomal protein L21